MKAVQFVAPGKPLEDFEVSEPVVLDTDVLIRIKAAGICHSDAHYRAGFSTVAFKPISLGHEVAGVIEKIGSKVNTFKIGQHVAVHYLATCGVCRYCKTGNEQFCSLAEMIGKQRNGGYAEMIVMPATSVVNLPESIPFEHAAVMMCSTATSFHALRKTRVQPGETVAVFGCGGLGINAIQLAYLLGASQVYAVDIQENKLSLASKYQAIAIDGRAHDPVQKIRELTGGIGVDVSLELVGLPATMQQAIQCLAYKGRVCMVGLNEKPIEINIYKHVLGKEVEIIGCSDHLISELPIVLNYARHQKLDFSHIVTKKVALQANDINATLDALVQFRSDVRTVIVP